VKKNRPSRRRLMCRRKRKRVGENWIVVLPVVLIIIALMIKGCRNEEPSSEAEEVNTEGAKDTEEMERTGDVPDLSYPFDTMSADWGEDDIAGWYHYEIPSAYQETGGYFPDLVQVYIFCLCREYGLDSSMVFAIIEYESGYHYDAKSSAGAVGYMQIMYKWHGDGVISEDELLNPYTNIRIGLQYLNELKEEFDTEEEILTAYNYGASGAKKLWGDGENHSSEYAEKVMEIEERIKADMEERDGENTY
jgi:hypothetical protein